MEFVCSGNSIATEEYFVPLIKIYFTTKQVSYTMVVGSQLDYFIKKNVVICAWVSNTTNKNVFT